MNLINSPATDTLIISLTLYLSGHSPMTAVPAKMRHLNHSHFLLPHRFLRCM